MVKTSKGLHHWHFIHQWLADSPHKGPVMQKAFSCELAENHGLVATSLHVPYTGISSALCLCQSTSCSLACLKLAFRWAEVRGLLGSYWFLGVSGGRLDTKLSHANCCYSEVPFQKHLNLRALKLSCLNKIHIVHCMGNIFCVEFQREPLKFHTKYLAHTVKDMIFVQHWNFKNFKNSHTYTYSSRWFHWHLVICTWWQEAITWTNVDISIRLCSFS